MTTKQKQKLKAEINKIETKRRRQRFKETKTQFCGNTNKIDRPLSKLTKRQRLSKSFKTVNKHEDIVTDSDDIERMIWSELEIIENQNI